MVIGVNSLDSALVETVILCVVEALSGGCLSSEGARGL
jgi:hypothetical protein